ncbi:8050_t:CDS:2, partial [Entrophospora sp. SA101]
VKQDFTYNKSVEHTLISKFLSYIAQISKDEKWIMAANKLKKDGILVSNQTQNEEVKRFWLDVEIERGEFQMKQTEIQFIVDRSISNNKAHDLIEEQKLNFISNYEKRTLNSGKICSEKINKKIKTTKTISEDTNTYSEEDGENGLEVIEHVGENLTEFEIKISGKLTTILRKAQEKEKFSKKTHMDSFLLNVILKEFKEYINQFNEKYCKRAWVPTLVRKSFIYGRFDPYYNEDYDIAQQIMTHCSVRLEAPVSNESNYGNLERTYSIDTIVYIISRLFRMHSDMLDLGWIELTTPSTKKHKFDGVLKVIKTKKTNKAIVLIEFSKGKKATEKKGDDHVKLCRNAMRILNDLLKTVSKEIARVYIIQSVSK